MKNSRLNASICASVLSMLPIFGGAAWAQSPYDSVIQARSLPGWEQADGTIMAGLRLTLEPGWKTYWRAPGDAGIPPTFDFSASENLHAAQIHWPRPEVHVQSGMRTLGYSDFVVLPVTLTPQTTTKDMRIEGSVDLGVCRDVCVPATVTFSGDLPGSGGEAAIRSALRERPDTAESANVGTVTCSLEPLRDGMKLSAEITMPALTGDEVAVIELANREVWVSEAVTTRNGDVLSATVDMVPPNAAPFAVARSDVRITVLSDTGQAVDIRGCTGG